MLPIQILIIFQRILLYITKKYIMWISGIHSLSESIQAYIFGAFMIFVGIIIQCVVIKKLSIRDNFKGFPGTVFPFLGTVLAYLAVYYVLK